MTREQRILKAQALTKATQEDHKMFLENGYIEGPPEEVAEFLVCLFKQEHLSKCQIWYLDKEGTANVC